MDDIANAIIFHVRNVTVVYAPGMGIVIVRNVIVTRDGPEKLVIVP